MLPSLKGLVLFIIALVPGVPGETIYSKYVGRNSSENKLRRLTRIIVISAAGLVLLIGAEDLLCWIGLEVTIDPVHMLPSYYADLISGGGLGDWADSQFALAYGAHTAFSTAAGLAIAFGWDYLGTQLTGRSYPSAWESIIGTHSKGRWIAVTSANGDTFAGMIDTANTNVNRDSRDLVLKEPAKYNERLGVYVAMPLQYLFLPAKLIESVAVLYNQDDERVTEVGEIVFAPEHASNEARNDGTRSNDARKGDARKGDARSNEGTGKSKSPRRETAQEEDPSIKSNSIQITRKTHE